jgi:beta-lactamase regulating signal transducer with metallopeptidase domain
MMAPLLGIWSTRLLDVSWQTGIVAALAWAACRLFPRIPAHVRAALWWLVCLKFVLGLVWIQPIALAWLPAVDADASAPEPAVGIIASSDGAVQRNSSASATIDAAAPSGRDLIVPALAALWISGIALQLALTWRAWRRTRLLVEESVPASPTLVAVAEAIRQRVGVQQVAIRVSAAIETPRVTGAFHPTILLPEAATQLSRADLEMTLCHELVHIRRGDLVAGWLPSLAQGLFFFHPFAWLATREYALAREAACDAAVLDILDTEPDIYGALLLRLGITDSDIAPVAVGASSSFRTLKRRLIMLQHTSEKARAHVARWWIVAAGIGLAAIPLQLVAAQREREPVRVEEQHAKSKSKSTHDAWVLLHGGDDNVMMSGSMSDVAEAGRQRANANESLLWFRRDGQEYVVRDRETIEAIEALSRPMHELGERQGALGNEQGKLGERQGRFGAQQGELGQQMAELSAKINAINAQQMELEGKGMRASRSEREAIEREVANLDRQMRRVNEQMEELSRKQEGLGREQDVLGREQDKFGRLQDELGAKQDEAGRRMERELRELIERALATGRAKKSQ